MKIFLFKTSLLLSSSLLCVPSRLESNLRLWRLSHLHICDTLNKSHTFLSVICYRLKASQIIDALELVRQVEQAVDVNRLGSCQFEIAVDHQWKRLPWSAEELLLAAIGSK